MRFNISLLLILITASSFSCSGDDSLLNFVEITDDFSHIEDPYERWKAYDLKNYSIIQSRSCECNPPYEARILVLESDISNVEICFDGKAKRDDETTYCDAESLKRAKRFALTIEEAFALIKEHEETAHSIRVNYHLKFGFPEEIHIDIVEMIADEEIHFYFEGLKKIK